MGDWEVVEATVGAVRHQGQVLLLKRRPDDRSFPGAWCFPGGRLDPLPGGGLESAPDALVREVLEEAGLVAQVHDFMGIFDSPWPARQRIYRIHCYLLATPHPGVRLSEEHTEACWLTPGAPPPTPLAGPVTRWLLDRIGPLG